MNSIQQWLKEADPVRREEPLAIEDAQAMRRRVIAAVDDRREAGLRMPQFRVAIAAIALIASIATPLTHLWESADTRAVIQPLPSTERAADTRQLQFDTPGGTRVIWVFNSEFEP